MKFKPLTAFFSRYKLEFVCSFFLSVLLLSFAGQASATSKEDNLKRAVVKIYANTAAPDYFTPWRLLNSRQSSGSGSVIANNRILTNAHVVADARYLQVTKHGDARKYLAKVLFVAHETDLAIITVEDEHFFEGIKPLSFGSLPKLLEEVSVYGYPFGGNTLSVTKGIMSRVEHQKYAHGNQYFLAGQVDAAINPGNSGGPVIIKNKIVGVVMQSRAGGRAENLGYFVPPSVIKHVLDDARDGSYEGFSDMGLRLQTLESPAIKAVYGLKPEESGALVVAVFDGASAFAYLQKDDVIMSIDGYDLADNLTVKISKDLRTSYKYVTDQYSIGEDVSVVVSRHGVKQTIVLPLKSYERHYNLVQRERFDTVPRYYVYGGVVFVPLNMNLIKRWGHDWVNKAPIDFLQMRQEWSTPEKLEVVVALKVLAGDVNLGFHDWKNWVVASVNDEPILDFRHFCEMLEQNSHEFVSFKDDNGFQLVMNHENALSSEEDILSLYQVPNKHSVGLFSDP
ncbi:MAG: protease [Alteromonadaceae bacterium]|nr:MAG: protease [Alteromonadaceae bacterium]